MTAGKSSNSFTSDQILNSLILVHLRFNLHLLWLWLQESPQIPSPLIKFLTVSSWYISVLISTSYDHTTYKYMYNKFILFISMSVVISVRYILYKNCKLMDRQYKMVKIEKQQHLEHEILNHMLTSLSTHKINITNLIYWININRPFT